MGSFPAWIISVTVVSVAGITPIYKPFMAIWKGNNPTRSLVDNNNHHGY